MDPWELEPFSGWARSGWVLAAQLRGSEVPQVVPLILEASAGVEEEHSSFKMGGVGGAPVFFCFLSHIVSHRKPQREMRATVPRGSPCRWVRLTRLRARCSAGAGLD